MSTTAEANKIKCFVRGELKLELKRLREWTGSREVLEVLVEGPRGSGKSRPLVTFLYDCAIKYRGCKILVVRKTRHSLTESFCKTFEEDVLPFDKRTIVLGDADRSNRSHYQFPNGSRIVLVGLDKPSKHQSTDWDIVFVEEASEVSWRQVEPFFGALRQFTPGIPWQLMLCATNPDAPGHWLNRRAINGQMTRVVTHHKDNPKWYLKDETTLTEEGRAFITSLQRYTGVARDRHVLGLWRGAEGMVWDNFDERIHIIKRPDRISELGLKWFCGAMDWGTQAPGVLQIWGIDGDNRAYRVAEWFHTHKSLDWWADRVVESFEEFGPFRAIVADPSRQDCIEHMNRRLGAHTSGKVPHLVRPANNRKTRTGAGDLSGLDLVRVRLSPQKDGRPAIFFVEGSLRCKDENLVAEDKPHCTEQEFPQYVRELDEMGEVRGEDTDKDCSDHGMDCTRYSQNYLWGRDLSDPPIKKTFAPGSLGARLGHEKLMARMR